MRTSQYLFSTLKETPNDAQVVSHQLMLRAGMIRPMASCGIMGRVWSLGSIWS